MAKKPVIGILGGIGSGKSTVAGCFADLGCVVLDADVLAHDILDEPDVMLSLVNRWGPDVLDDMARVDRGKVAEKVFDSPEELDFLQRLVHPRVLQRCEAVILAFQGDPDVAGIVLDMPLLLEVGWEKKCDFLVFVDCCEEKRRRRIEKNGKFDIEQLKIRENLQISLDKKKEKAHYMINNNSDKSDMAEQVAQIFSSMTGSK
ncbi:MAG: dephospho-CoA kinase [Phycisphaerae bacterium]|nr:dephospho-CoA kinase [Phycisphaerae bacterium]